MESSSKISVIVPVYNAGKYIGRCVHSILNNTYHNIEIICVNDGSTDNSLAVLQNCHDSRLSIINQENKGVSEARNAGLKVAKGDFICFVDSDDWINESFFFELLSIQKRTNAGIVACGFQRVNEHSIVKESTKCEVREASYFTLVKEYSSFENYIWAKLYKKEVLCNASFCANVSMCEDKLFNLSLLLHNSDMECAFYNSQLYYYYNQIDSIVHSESSYKILPASNELYRLSLKSNDERIKTYILDKTIKTVLSARYLTMFKDDAAIIRKSCNELLSLAYSGIRDSIDFSSKLKYRFLIWFPFVYRLLRIASDRTMLQWERSQREKHE